MIANISLYSLDDPRIDCCMTAFIKVILSMLAKMLMGDIVLFGDLFLENRVCHFIISSKLQEMSNSISWENH